MSLTNVAIIGANGFIGTHLTKMLLNQTHLKISLFGRSNTNQFQNQISYTQLNLNDSEQIATSFKNIELVYYLASESIPSSSWDNPNIEIERNLLPFINFLNCISNTSVKKIVFVSSAGTIYGKSSKKLTEDSDKKPFSPYGITKLAMENFLNYFEVKHLIHYDVFRVSNVYGVGQDTSKGLGIINTFLEKIINENKVLIYGDGTAIRNYINVEDVANLLSRSITSDYKKSNIYNLASNDNLSINEIVDVVKSVVDEAFIVNYKETRQSDNPAISIDNSKILNEYPDFKFTNIKEGIKQIYEFLKTTQKANTN